MSLAIFDLDNTLLAGDSDHSWGEFIVEQGVVSAESHKTQNDAFYESYCDGSLDIQAYLRFVLQPLVSLDKTKREHLHQKFMNEKIEPLILPQARALVERHKKSGDTLMIITATNRFITQAIAHRFGIYTLLASEAEYINDTYTGEPMGTPCFAEGKVERLNTWMQENKVPNSELEHSYFYSDSHNDLPLLSLVGNPVAVDPDDILRSAAKRNGWPIVSLRK